ncbi:MAG: DNA primase [Ruminococcaceae bacterium]|nr:DNA primase [Oscillospiraceae bacterium]
MIDRRVVEEIKYRNDIRDVISQYVTLKRAGSNYNGLCPFHSEKTPSFTVFTAGEGNFYCFGCGAGGDVVTFVMRAENLDYPSALEFLAKRAGIDIPEDSAKSQGEVSRTRVMDMNREAARFFHATLVSGNYPEALSYLRDKRAFPPALIRHFGLGFAPNEWGSLVKHLKSKHFSEEEMIAANLAAKSAKGTVYDVFRNRIIVPILDINGNVVAFGGRVMDDSKPKYLNSTDTPAFKKRRTLFALNFAKDLCAERMILCEGYMDVIALHGAGFSNAIATLGTAITEEHARLMKRYTKEVVICYDADEAGQRAADKAFSLLSEVGLETKILKVEGAKDPDEYIKKYGAGKFKLLLEGSRTRFDFKLGSILEKHDITVPLEKIRAADEAAELIAGFYSAVERDIYIDTAARKLSVPTDTLKADVQQKIRSRQKKENKEELRRVMSESAGYGNRTNPDYVRNPAAASAEETILGLILYSPELLGGIEASGELREETFQTEFNRRVFAAIRAIYNDHQTLEEGLLSERFTPEEMGRIIGMKVRRTALTNNGEDVLKECIARLQNARTKGNNIEDIEDILGAKRRKQNE